MRAPSRRTSYLPAGIALLALAGGASGAGCYAPNIDDGTLECASGDRCPRGFVCRVSVNLCFRAQADAGVTDGSPGGERDATGQETALDIASEHDGPPDVAIAHDAPPDVASDGRDAPLDVAQPDVAPPDVAPEVKPDTGAPDAGNPKNNGSPCTQSSACASQHCVDGVCCNDACTDRCKACDVGASPGTCMQVTSGPPHGTRGPCPGSGTCGAGACSAASATACAYPGDETTCRSASCSGATFTARAGCNGAGSCPAATTSSCGDLACNASGTACLTTCTADNQCATAARPYCDAGACVSGRANGARCTTAGECASQRCVDGFCCNDACQLPCQACDVAGHAGSCWPIANGTPYGGRPACGGAGDCAGFCNNVGSGQCFYPGSTKSCACPGGISSGTCNGLGQCQTLAGICL